MEIVVGIACAAAGCVVTLLVAKFSNRKHWEELKKVKTTYVCLTTEFEMTHKLANKLIRAGWGKPDVILALSSGGEMVAQWLSRRFLGDRNKRIAVHTIVVDLTTKVQNGKPVTDIATINKTITLSLKGLTDGAKVLLVTDIIRTGKGLMKAKDYLMDLEQFKNGEYQLATAALVWTSIDDKTRPDYFFLDTENTVRFDWKEEKPSPHGLPCANRCS